MNEQLKSKKSIHLVKDLSEYAEDINVLLLDFFNEQRVITQPLIFSRDMIKDLTDFCCRGGKRLRPALVYYSYKLFGGEKDKEILKVSLAVELIHTFLLIHDDIIDNDDLRRGKATIHKIYEHKHPAFGQNTHKAKHFGKSMTLLTGDLSLSLAFTTFLSTNFSSDLKNKAVNKLCETIKNTIFGQTFDVWLEVKNKVKSDEILNVYIYKTAKYSFEAPLYIGAMLVGVSKEEFQNLSSYAIPCGIAFQIKDDILGVFGNEKNLGKPIDSDLKQGKQTLIIFKAQELGTKTEREKIQSALGNENLTNKDVDEIRSIIKNTGALVYCEDLAEKYVKKAKKALAEFDSKKYNQSSIKKLNEIADFIIKRQA